jgi:hypothetical protein
MWHELRCLLPHDVFPSTTIVCRYGSPVFGTLMIEPEVSGQNNWTKVSPIPWYQTVLQTNLACWF